MYVEIHEDSEHRGTRDPSAADFFPSSSVDALALHLDAGLGSLGLDLAADRRAALIAFLRLLHRWNRVYNLSGVRDPDAMVTRHLLDSLAVLPYLYGERLLDIGSGAGIPGMVLALAIPIENGCSSIGVSRDPFPAPSAYRARAGARRDRARAGRRLSFRTRLFDRDLSGRGIAG